MSEPDPAIGAAARGRRFVNTIRFNSFTGMQSHLGLAHSRLNRGLESVEDQRTPPTVPAIPKSSACTKFSNLFDCVPFRPFHFNSQQRGYRRRDVEIRNVAELNAFRNADT